ncbi:hypothetical protein [Amycolatopsis aidingensis]|uniref:hypothetical protein n=1 Tax=Amycolatopsis aidingensis TaxID=2842453 RepID=UPI001C0C3289|nr:hypothetical protein [Amycolatopsis aidingensis]
MWPRWRRWPNVRPDRVCAVYCRDDRGRRTRVTIALCGDRVLIGEPDGGQWWLSPLQAGRLRAALRDLVLRDAKP